MKKELYYFFMMLQTLLIVFFFLMVAPHFVEASVRGSDERGSSGLLANKESSDTIIKRDTLLQITATDTANQEEIEQSIFYSVTEILREQNEQDYHLIDVIVPNNLPKSGIGTVKLVFNKGNINVPIVEELNVDRVNLSYEVGKHQFSLSDLQKNPDKIVKEINSSKQSKKDVTFSWVNEQGQDISQTDLGDRITRQEDWYLLTQEKNQTGLAFVEKVSYEQLEAYLIKDDLVASQGGATTFDFIEVETRLPIILRDELQAVNNSDEMETLINETLRPSFKIEGSNETVGSYRIEYPDKINQETLSGTVFPVTYYVMIGQYELKMNPINVTVLPTGTIDNLDDWEIIPFHPKDRSLWLLENPINHAKAGFPHRGLNLDWEFRETYSPKELSFHVIDETPPLQSSKRKGYSYMDELTAFIPYENNRAIYVDKSYPSSIIRELGWGHTENKDMSITSSFFLAKRDKEGEAPTQLKQIFVEGNESFVFVLDLSMKRNLNYEMMMTTYNVGERSRDIAMLEMLDTDYYNDTVPMYVYGNNRGFYMLPPVTNQDPRRITFVLKNKKGQWLSDYTMMAPGEFVTSPKPTSPYMRDKLFTTNAFGDSFNTPGLEGYPNLKDGDLIIEKKDTAYELGAPYKRLGNDDKMTVGYEMFLGNEIPYSTLTLTEDHWMGYVEDRPDKLKIPYKLTDLPSELIEGDTTGVFYTKDREGNEVQVGSYNLPEGEETVEGTLDLDLKKLMGKSTLFDGDIEEYPISITSITQTNGIPDYITSEEEIVLITSYAFGAQVKGKTVNKDSNWKTEPEELLEDKAVLPDHNATYEYVEKPPINTKDLGLHWVKVKMTDKTANKTKTYEVPVSVVDGNLPSRGIHLAAKDVSTKTTDIKELTERQLDSHILKESQATAWDNVTGSLDNITKRVTSKTVHPNSKPGDYEATIVAENGAEKTEKTIKVTVLTEIDIQVNQKKLPDAVPLGADIRSLDNKNNFNDWITVTSGSESVEDYKVTLEEFDTHRISDKDKPNGQLKVVVDGNEMLVPINIPVVWGNSVAIGGSNTTLMNQESALALSLHDDETGKYLSMSYGNLPENRQNTPLNATLGNKPFVQVKRYATDSWKTGKDDALEVTDGPNKESDVIYSVPGNAVPNDALIKGFGKDGRLTIKEGDVIGLYTADAYHKVLYNDSEGPLKPIQGLPQDNTSFGVVVGDNFYPTYLAHLKPEGVTIPVDDTRSEKAYDDHLATSWRNYLSIPNGVSPSTYAGVEQGGYKKYPTLNLGVGEKSAGEVYARQATTVNNQYIKYAYPITVVGSGPDLTLEDIPDTIDFGTPLIKSRTQHLQQEKENKVWGFKVMDNREDTKRQPWMIQMKAEPFKTGVQANYQPLKGSVLTVQADKQQVDLNTEFQRVYLNERPEKGTNEINWTGKDGFYLTVPPGYIKSESPYTSSVDILLSNVPETSQP